MMTYVKPTRPPPPTPWIDLPTRRVAILSATEARIVPMIKSNSAKRRTDLRSMICENEAHVG
jgi:hypothetical protein